MNTKHWCLPPLVFAPAVLGVSLVVLDNSAATAIAIAVFVLLAGGVGAYYKWREVQPGQVPLPPGEPALPAECNRP